MEGRRMVDTWGVAEIICTGRCLCWWEGWVWASQAHGDGSAHWVKVCMPTPVESQRAAVQRCSRMSDEELNALMERARAFERDLRQTTSWQRLREELEDARQRVRRADGAELPDMPPSQRARTQEPVQPYSGMGAAAAWLPGVAAESEMPRALGSPAGAAEEGAALTLPSRGGTDAGTGAPSKPPDATAS